MMLCLTNLALLVTTVLKRRSQLSQPIQTRVEIGVRPVSIAPTRTLMRQREPNLTVLLQCREAQKLPIRVHQANTDQQLTLHWPLIAKTVQLGTIVRITDPQRTKFVTKAGIATPTKSTQCHRENIALQALIVLLELNNRALTVSTRTRLDKTSVIPVRPVSNVPTQQALPKAPQLK